MDKIAKALEIIAVLVPEVGVIKELLTLIRSGSEAELDAFIARLQAENDVLGTD